MGTLSFTATVSLDGYVADASGDFGWSTPSDEVFRFHVERMSAVSTEVLGRRTYELMRYWLTDPDDGSWSPDEHEFARRWRGLDRVAASSTLEQGAVAADGARLVRRLGLAELEQIVHDAAGEVEIFGPTTAAAAIRAGVVNDYRFFIVPQTIGGGVSALPEGAQLDLRLVEHRVFANGTIYAHYTSPAAADAWRTRSTR
ncbi:dihydrofolate reductase family protein [Microbacterium sp. Marseille-Q6965]|uniref:dihydrofolate reductase family protein n=1 Tax=Microbacterium sp. Marseille-Q6965 TaxID=2965072 RepID=UPI0021B7F6A2|nr:dihydrofolate reductase family protein [Microbacterium sp. Marseille-Q6965]